MTRMIEVCSNAEWLLVFGPLADLGSESVFRGEDAADEWWSIVCRRLESAFAEVECVPPKGQRRTCHGWNGANTFEHHQCGLGTFAQFTALEWDHATDIACEEAARLVAEYAALDAAMNDSLSADD